MRREREGRSWSPLLESINNIYLRYLRNVSISSSIYYLTKRVDDGRAPNVGRGVVVNAA